jgi:hypothetical protein
MEFTVENVVARTRALRDEFGSAEKLAEAAGCSKAVVYNWCSPATIKKVGYSKEGWEKHFGPWDKDSDKNTDTNHSEENPVKEIIAEEAVVEPTKAEPEKSVKEEKQKARLIIEVPSLEELEEALRSFGFRLEFVPR